MRIAIAGCGPAGLATALILNEQGYEVSLLERFDSPRPIGSGIILQPTGLAVLGALGLHDQILRLGKRIDRMHGIVMPAGKQVLDVDYTALGNQSFGLAVHRAALFEVLYEAVQRKAINITTNVDVSGIGSVGDSVALSDTSGGTHGPFDLIVDASGARSRLQCFAVRKPRSRKLAYGAIWGTLDWPDSGFDANVLSQRYVGAHTMIGVLPIGRHSAADCDQVAFFWSLRADDYRQWLADGLDQWKQHVRSIWPGTEVILDQIKDPAQMSLAEYGHCTLSLPYGEKLVFVGDSAHATSPQLGQGANMALLDAWALGLAMSGANNIDDTLGVYAQLRRWHVRAFQLSSLLLTPFYQSDSRLLAALRDLLFDPVSRLPGARRLVAGLISGMLGDPLRKLKLD